MDIEIKARLSAQVDAGRLGIRNKYTHIVTLRNNDDLVTLQIPHELPTPFESIDEIRAVVDYYVDNDLPFYPCVGTGFGVSIDGDTGDFILSKGYSSQVMETQEFIPNTFKDKVL